MEVFHLRYFAAVAENLSFSKAARQLHMAVSPLSRRVRDLERELDVRLFERDSHSVNLTAAGTALLPLANDVLSRFDDLPGRLRQQVGAERRAVHVGVPPGLHPRLRERLREFDRVADCEVRRWPGGSQDLLDQVRRRGLELALVHLPAHAEGVESREVLREPLGAVLPASEFAGRESVSLTELTGHVYARPGSGLSPTYFDQLEVRLAAAGVHRRTTLSTRDYSGLGEFVANGGAFGISMLDPQNQMGRPSEHDQVLVLPFADFDPVLATGLIWRADRAEPGADLADLISEGLRILS
ncbi:LysR family transcriptional regulator [Saccharopolyspora gloriosae]|uniref:LysR family transcriptional regulator n=1 Tax=Saccharopolyspora gloriosae TaxID=455344 RepID=UPI001FB73DE6|nr:LysR family transcriptional regulator [Saccharopolyspora gloriosae]